MVRYWVEIQQWKMVSGGPVKERKERKGWERGEKGERQQGWGRKTPASIQGWRVNLGRAATVHSFSGCGSGDLESNLQAPAV
jgi:hypothetical protein